MDTGAHLVRMCEASRHGSIDFARFMQVALYDPDTGYYAGSPERAGLRGDFVTSPELGDAFARCVEVWISRGAGRRVADVGGGRGTLATQVRDVAAEAGRSVETAVVDASEAARRAAAGAEHVVAGTVRDLPWTPDVVVANELLDNLPARLMSSPDTERCVGVRDGRLVWVDRPAPEGMVRAVDGVSGVAWQSSAHGIVPVPVGAWAWLDSLPRGVRLLLVDYGAEVTELLGRTEAPVRAYRGHARVDPVAEPGTADITCEVPLDLVERHAAVSGLALTRSTQADWLDECGLDSLRQEVVKAQGAAIRSRDTMGELRARHRLNELKALADPDGLGGFAVLTSAGT
ncbi:MAG: SAM-dependent methyltransferase [Acidimicrobiia bacterium]|nr:SAM-dependent methyltransferase [Acidimicrobiia bacterium]